MTEQKKVGLALAGGGARGAYHIGVWKALRELDVHFDIVTGTSVGALTGGVICDGNFELAEQVFSNIKNSDVMELPENIEEMGGFLKYFTKNGGVNTTPLKKMLESIVNEDNVRASGLDFGMVIVDRGGMYPVEATLETIPNGELISYMLASASIFPFFQATDIDGKKYIDGGYYDNVPTALCEDMGADEIIAVTLNGIGKDKPYRGGLPVRTIYPTWPLGSIVQFDSVTAKRNIKLGYYDTMKAYGKYDGQKYIFGKGQITEAAENWDDSVIKNLVSSLPGVARKSVLALLSEEYEAHRNKRRMYLAGLESAARVFNVDPTVEYTPESLIDIILEIYGSAAPLNIKFRKEKISADINDSAAAVTMCDMLRGNRKKRELSVMAAALPREFAAAAFIYTLLGPYDEPDNPDKDETGSDGIELTEI